MIMTEEEAGGIVCHKTLAFSPTEPRPCIASACMAWRWRASLTVQRPQGLATPGGGQTIKHERGFCGLAGEP